MKGKGTQLNGIKDKNRKKLSRPINPFHLFASAGIKQAHMHNNPSSGPGS